MSRCTCKPAHKFCLHSVTRVIADNLRLSISACMPSQDAGAKPPLRQRNSCGTCSTNHCVGPWPVGMGHSKHPNTCMSITKCDNERTGACKPSLSTLPRFRKKLCPRGPSFLSTRGPLETTWMQKSQNNGCRTTTIRIV
jgi:hypothetical protein